MDAKKILQKYLLFTSISEYRGSAKSLVEMIYWAMGEIVSVRSIEKVVADNTQIGEYYLTVHRSNDRIEVRIAKSQAEYA